MTRALFTDQDGTDLIAAGTPHPTKPCRSGYNRHCLTCGGCQATTDEQRACGQNCPSAADCESCNGPF